MSISCFSPLLDHLSACMQSIFHTTPPDRQPLITQMPTPPPLSQSLPIAPPPQSSLSEEELLQRKWIEIVRPHVGVSHDTMNRPEVAAQQAELAKQSPENLDSSEQIQRRHQIIYDTYHFGNVVCRIKKMRSEEGKLIYIYIGKTPFERVPPAPKDVVWVVMDCCIQPYYTAEVVRDDLDPNLPFLLMNCNLQKGLSLIAGLGDRIYIDTSTTKFFTEAFALRFGILLHDAQSALIFYNPTKLDFNYNVHLPEKLDTSSWYALQMPISSLINFKKLTQAEFPNVADERKIYELAEEKQYDYAFEVTKNHLFEGYHIVEKCPTNLLEGIYENPEGRFFLVRHPKSTSSNSSMKEKLEDDSS